MDFFKKLLKNDTTVVGLCDLKRRTTLNSFGFIKGYNFSRPFAVNEIPGGMLYTK